MSKLGGADQAIGGTGERRADQQNVGYLEEFIESIWRSDPVHSLIRPATSVDGMHPHADAGHQSAGRGANAAEAEESAERLMINGVVSFWGIRGERGTIMIFT
jgi:hypothetical protein